jgi:hypothetical protein
MSTPSHGTVEAELKRLTDEFFRAVSFNVGEKPSYSKLHELFIEPGLLIKNSGTEPEISTVAEFIRPCQASVDAGELTQFHEAEIAEATEVFGNVAQRFSAYIKSGTLKGTAFERADLHAVHSHAQRLRMSSMAWDDEHSGLNLPKHFEPTEFGSATQLRAPKTVPTHVNLPR